MIRIWFAMLLVSWLANLAYLIKQRSQFDRSEVKLILRRSWIPGYLVYHDGIYQYATPQPANYSLAQMVVMSAVLRLYARQFDRLNRRINRSMDLSYDAIPVGFDQIAHSAQYSATAVSWLLWVWLMPCLVYLVWVFLEEVATWDQHYQLTKASTV